MTLTEGRWRRPMWAPGNVLEVPKDGPWARLLSPGQDPDDDLTKFLITACELHDDWEPAP